jgi:hypothetical protein
MLKGGFLMSTNKTAHYKLHSWVPGDDFIRAEFNENFDLIDSAIEERMVVGTYTGDATAERFIDLGFTPRAVLVLKYDSELKSGSSVYGGLAVTGQPVVGRQTVLKLTDGGFLVYYEYSNYGTLGTNSGIFNYLAIR